MREAGDVQTGPGTVLASLPFRVVAFLSLALLPIGLLAIWQTSNLDDTLRARTELSLIALTEIAVSGERQSLQRAVGAATGQAITYELASDDPTACSAAFRAFRDADPSVAFAGFLPPTGVVSCSSEDSEFTVGPPDRIAALATRTTPSLIPRLRDGDVSISTAMLMQPVIKDNVVLGQIVLSLPTSMISESQDLGDVTPPLSLTIYNRDGDVILTSGNEVVDETINVTTFDDARQYLEPQTFVGRNAKGEQRVYVSLTLVPDLAYAVAAWAPSEGFLANDAAALPSFLLPALMWLASLLVAYFAVHRLVVGPVKDLGNRMNSFATDRSLRQPKNMELLPQELLDLEQTFSNMAYDLIDDEAQMENSLREKNILLKEVHHRVKNNLQMISSIMNMQIRSATSADSRNALRRLQDRILGLATVHRNLYQSKDLARADARPLMADICAPILAAVQENLPTAQCNLNIDDFALVPDQAVPLALLVGEVASNAVKHADRQSVTPFVMTIRLSVSPDGMARLNCTNTATADQAQADGDGVGRQLIRAFALQLGGDYTVSDQDGLHQITVEFPLTAAIPEALDY